MFTLVLSCGTKPAAPVPEETPPPAITERVSEPVEPPPETIAEPKPAEETFDPATISEEVFTAAKTDVQALIGELNGIIRARNFNSWKDCLSESYFALVSSPEFLEERTEELYKRDQIVASNLGRDPKRIQKKILKTPRDYFINVVVPSRQNDRMDDITFISENRVTAYTLDGRGNRLILYDLEFINNKWVIIN